MKVLAVTSSQLPYGLNPTDGAGYRMWILFKRLAKEFEVEVLSLYEDMYQGVVEEGVDEEGMKITPIRCSKRSVSKHIKDAQPDSLYLGSWTLYPFLPRLKIPLVVDFIGPSLLENVYLGRYPQHLASRIKAEAYSKADFILCSNERLSRYLIGFLVSRGVIKHPDSIRVIPLIPPSEKPSKNKNFKRVKSKGERVILVAGSLNPWYDYETLFEAAGNLDDLNFHLLFLGDNPTTIKRDVKRSILLLAEKTGMKDRVIVSGLIPFKDRANYYLQADFGLNLANRSLEDELSSRARLVDYVWADLPIITSGHDYLSTLLTDNGAALPCIPKNSEDLSDKIRVLVEDEKKRRALKRQLIRLKKEAFSHERWIKPLLEFLREEKGIQLKVPSMYARISELAFNVREKLRARAS